MKDHPLVLFEPCLYLIAIGVAYRSEKLGLHEWLAFPTLFAVRGLYLRFYALRKWKSQWTNTQMYGDLKKYYWSPHIHWTQKLSILQQRTGVFTLLVAYVLLVMALAGFVWIFLQFRR